MKRDVVQSHMASSIARTQCGMKPPDILAVLVALEVDIAESGKTGMVGYKKGSKRVSIRVGRFVNQFFGTGLNDNDIQNIAARIVALLWPECEVEEVLGVKEVTGEELRTFYHESVSGISSCMAHSDTQPYLDIYVDNPDKVSLATVSIGSRSGRALVWTFPDGKRYMDRIYCTSDACRSALTLYAETKLNGGRSDIPSDQLTMKIRDGKGSYWPYIDTLFHMSILDQKTCTLSARCGDYVVQTTDGSLFSDDDLYCSSCDNRIAEGCECVGPDDEILCEDCYCEACGTCECCDSTTWNDDLTGVHGGRYVCRSCLEDAYEECHGCNEYFENDCVNEVDGNFVCERCFEDNYSVCDECGESMRNNDARSNPDNTMTLCRCCFGDNYVICGMCDGAVSIEAAVDGCCPDCALEDMVGKETKSA